MFDLTIGSNNDITLDQSNSQTATSSGEGTNEIVQTAVNAADFNFGIILTPGPSAGADGSSGA
ncbi:MAG: hypothetical protein AB7R89_27930 [Dehalococcoidia bacterium]